MRLTSLRSKIFLLVGLTLLVSAIAVMLVTEHDVRQTVVASERLAVRNVLNLLLRDSDARWGSLLNDKITTVRADRKQMVEQGDLIRSVLNMYAGQVARKELSVDQAQRLARQWIDQLFKGRERFSFVFGPDLTVIASGNGKLRGASLAGIKDFKGHALASAAYQESRTSGQSFALYRWPQNGKGSGELRYAYFAYFQPWDWVYAITDNAREVVKQFDVRRKEMEHAIGQTLESLRLAQSGFAFIAADDGTLVAPLPKPNTGLLQERDAGSDKTLHDLLRAIPPDGRISSFQFDGTGKDPWEITAAYFKPLKWTIVAAVPTHDLTAAAIKLRNRLAWVFLVVLVASLAVAWALSTRISRPLRQLTDFARKLPEQDLSTAAPIPEHISRLPKDQPDEVGRLAATFIFMDQQLREKIARLVQETSSRERFESELNIAHSIQMGLLPVPLEGEVLRKIDLHATMIPAKEVGGDLYDYFILPDGRLCFAIGDVSDKGVPAALFMAVTRTLIRASAEDETDPALIMERVNNRLSENNPNLMFVTLLLAVLDLDSGELAWCNAGHLPPCVLGTDGAMRMLTGRSGPACGVQEDIPYKGFVSTLEPGEIFVGYTDGVTEAMDPDNKQYEEARMVRLLTEQKPADAQAATAALLHDIRTFVRGAEQSDDITLIAVKRFTP
ncbi:SpoIIE family protein phosphatase [Candidimonas humi]|uniref:SpoIIE family protein phosphatase n=1 Tax=Candidimonas humi TaxID=683355 RepID=A0ABV8NXL7_9BURK|nr:SpoIIE family protein phosphatase [Candidimonas humi]MBV6306371.1 SpoIIE family protein phosphatase [Candidimonas humi]